MDRQHSRQAHHLHPIEQEPNMIQRMVLPAYLTLAVLVWSLPFSDAAESATVQVTFYVSPAGSDVNPGSEAKPFASIEKARQAVRANNANMTGDIVVMLRGGTYSIDHTIAFESEDSGSAGHNVIYRAQTGETPIISGGRPVVDWKPDEKGRWKAMAPVDDSRQLYVGGIRATRARGEKPADLELLGENGYKTTAVDMADWKNPSEVEFCYFAIWSNTRCRVQSIEREADRAIITMLQPQFTHAKTKEGINIVKADHLYIENALELLNEPGEWYLDRKAHTVYYMPRPSEDMTKVDVIVPALERLVELRGTPDRPVHNICFAGIAFEHGSWLQPNRTGLVDVQANFVYAGRSPIVRNGELATVHNEDTKSPSNIVCHAARSIRFERCTFAKLGSGGLDLEFGAQDNAIVGCTFHDISGTAVQIGDVLKDDHHPDDLRKIVKNNTVANCYIHDCCVEYMGGVGIFAGYTEGTVIAHNEITRLPYSGVSVGWGWGQEDAGGGAPQYELPYKYDTPTPAQNNRIEYNHIHHVMDAKSMYDGAGIYTLGNMPGSVIRGNHIHDNGHVDKGGIYLDEGSGFIEVTGNLIYQVPKAVNYNNLAQNRNATCNEHDNFFEVTPDEAKPIVEKAGLQAEYQDLLKEP
jgi:hypothetical protein